MLTNYNTLYIFFFVVVCVLLDSKASEKLSALLTNSQLCKDICRLSPVYQTSSLEAFHSVIIHFAPKYVPFSYHGMNCRWVDLATFHSIYLAKISFLFVCLFPIRLALACLHFNENASRKQAVTLQGEERYDILFPKYKKGGHIVRKVTVNPTYSKSLRRNYCYCSFIVYVFLLL